MSDGFVNVPTLDSIGAVAIDNTQFTRGGRTINRQRVEVYGHDSGEFEMTRFNELFTAQRTSQFNLKPTWGLTAIRYVTSTTGVGSSAAETGGEFRIQSGTDVLGSAQVQTNQRGQYQAGTMGQTGIGVRVPVRPTGTQFVEWGYTDFQNGFYFGEDATGVYVAVVKGGSITKIYQADWNIDKLNGTGESGETLDLSDGYVSQIDFTWYGYGDIEFSFLILDDFTRRIRKTVCHRVKFTGEASIVDPNQPLTFRAGNGASSTSSISLYIGGHQFSVSGGQSTPQRRNGVELLTAFTTALSTDWQPLIAMRKKALLNGRGNSVNVRNLGVIVASDGELETRLTVSGTTSNLAWATPTGFTAAETAVETKVTGGTALATSSPGLPILYGYIDAGNRTTQSFNSEVAFALAESQEFILWVRRFTASGAISIRHAHIDWSEEW